jgi:methyl-accepting chemotaxis protein
MSIKLKFIIIGILFIITIIMLGGITYIINKKKITIEQQADTVVDLISTVFERNLFFNDYFSEPTARVKQQLFVKNEGIGDVLTRAFLNFDGDEEAIEILYRIEKNYKHITANLGLFEESLIIQKENDLFKMLGSNILLASLSTIGEAQKLRQKTIESANTLRELSEIILISFYAISLFILFYISILAVYIFGSIKSLQDGTHAIASGNLYHRVKIHSRDELGVLGETLNDMAEELLTSYDKIKESKKILEDRVREQTSTLSQKVTLLEHFKLITEEREHKMIELKNRLHVLESEKK